MLRPALPLLLVAVLFLVGWDAKAEPPGSSSASPPLTYELIINGEPFLIQANRQERLQSGKTPSVAYDVALRTAMIQPVELNSLRFEYNWPAEVSDDRGRSQRTVRIRHELGYTLLVTDLGKPVQPGAEDEVLRIVVDSVLEGFRASGMEKIEEQKPHAHKFPAAAGRGVVIHYQDSQGYAQTCLVYVLTGETFAASCVAQYFDRQAENVVPRLRKTIESIRPIEQPPE